MDGTESDGDHAGTKAEGPAPEVARFVDKWAETGGAETANAQPFVIDLCHLLGVPEPAPQREENRLNDYVFERSVAFKHADGTTTPGRIDCYKRDCFVLEAKQSAKRQGARRAQEAADGGLFGDLEPATKAGHAKRGTGSWDTVMRQARKQAEDYARALPVDHGYPPFLLVVDVGHVIELFADFSGQGKNYVHFPDKQGFRIRLEDLHEPAVRDRLRRVWTDPQSLDPTRRAAEVTRDIADRLADVAKRLEGRHDPREVATFLMRCLFTMFAEEERVGLLPKDCFLHLLEQQKDSPETFPQALEQFWRTMDQGGYALHLNATIKRFNGTLFRDCTALPLDAEGIHELWVAARRDWSDVEPSIFGTLLEHALDADERSRLGAHYTPRAYVERLVIPTVIDPLRNDWQQVQAAAEELRRQGDPAAARKRLRDFLHQLATTRVLDPACGTGNFLYVALELMKRLEGEVVAALEDLGEDAPRLALQGETVNPQQFYGLELNPRAVQIADLVLWIGYLKWQIKTGGAASIKEPVLHRYGTIREQDAILTWDRRELRRDDRGRPITVWDGRSTKPHPVTGALVPDDTRRVESYRYINPRPAQWPEVEFVVGNPPFVAGKDLRNELGDGYAEAVWAARPHMPGGADFVVHFWDYAAELLRGKGTKLRRFGFITTNSVTQTFSRRVIERHMKDKPPLSLIFAVPNHPWLKQADKAAVRIAMTVAVRGEREGILAKSVRERGLNTDTPTVELEARTGKVLANLSLGADLSQARPLLANELLASPGIKLHGSGFIVTPKQAQSLGLGKVPGLDRHIRPYRHGRDLTQRPRGVMVIDLYPLRESDVRDHFPDVYQHVHDRVKPERDQNKRASYREKWWIFGEPRTELREFLDDLERYIATVETSKHRFFQFLDAAVRPDNMLVAIGLHDAAHLSLLSSSLHVRWMLAAGARLGIGNDPRYSKSRCFDPFPFQDISELSQATVDRLRDLGERLDRHRKDRLATHEHLTMTGLYNVLERVRALEAGTDELSLSESERDVWDAGQVGILQELHDEIDAEVLRAYGWDDLIDALVGKPGGTMPSRHNAPDQEAAEQELLSRLVALNRERAAEEKRGQVRWLRPEFQLPRLRHKLPEGDQLAAAYAEPVQPAAQPSWPKDGMQQIRVVHDVLAAADGPVSPDQVARAFSGRLSPKRRLRVEEVLQTLVATGAARTAQENGGGYFVPR